MASMIGFMIWTAVGCLIIGMGISAFFRKEAVGFWANVEVEPMSDIRRYNAATGKLLIAYGVVLMALGLPMLAGQNSPWIVLSVLGVMLETIAAMAIYTLVIARYTEMV